MHWTFYITVLHITRINPADFSLLEPSKLNDYLGFEGFVLSLKLKNKLKEAR